MNEVKSTDQPSGEIALHKDPAAAAFDWHQFLAPLAPHLPELTHKMFDSIKAHNAKSLTLSTVLLVAIVVALTGLAAYSLFLGKVDTAEKIVIALVSFLGGTALFGGGKK